MYMSKEQLSRGRLRMRAEATIYKLSGKRSEMEVEQILDEAFPIGYEAEAVMLIKTVLHKKFSNRPTINSNVADIMWYVERWHDARNTAGRESQHERPKVTAKGKGRPKAAIKEMMIDDDGGGKLKALHRAMGGKKGKAAATFIRAAVKLGWMVKPTFKAVENEFGDIGNRSGFNKYMADDSRQITDEEIAGAMQALENIISQ
jgi:hypothetical protein